MVSDNTTFFLSFATVFGFLGWYLWHLERKVDAMRRRLDDAEAATPKNPDRKRPL